ncbi:MAG: fumarylacetoacetate hydrolase family protein [Rhodothermus sp.]|nr:fumarylacetoacetate hydrolase family protein [Rhodothermus sp.]
MAVQLAEVLDAVWEKQRAPVEPLSETAGLTQLDVAYAVQQAWTALRKKRGEQVLGHKIGLTSLAMQQQMGVDQPDFGHLWASRYFEPHGTQATIPIELFWQPRLEGELAFLLGQDLEGPNITPQEVLGATEAIAASLEIVDSRIRDWRIRIYDTVADNASFGAFTLGPWQQAARTFDLQQVGMLLYKNGVLHSQGVGAACLGHPARAVAWLANTLSQYGVRLKAGDIVLSGALAASFPVARGDVCTLCMQGFPPLTVVFE